MKCEICKEKTDLNNSFGYEEFIVCGNCIKRMTKEVDDFDWILETIFRMGKIKRDYNMVKNARSFFKWI